MKGIRSCCGRNVSVTEISYSNMSVMKILVTVFDVFIAASLSSEGDADVGKGVDVGGQ